MESLTVAQGSASPQVMQLQPCGNIDFHPNEQGLLGTKKQSRSLQVAEGVLSWGFRKF